MGREDDDDVTQVTRIYRDAVKKLADSTEASEEVVDKAIALERAVSADPEEAKEKITSALPPALKAMPCRICGLPQYNHFLVTDHLWLARNEDR